MNSGTPSAHQQGPAQASPAGRPNIGRANSLLSRYGGQDGPTGVAAGPRSAADSPVSLANFMGGNASGPRLGKLADDAKSAPSEASEIHESRWVALPGLASVGNAGAKPLASFLEERANAAAAKRSSFSAAAAAAAAAAARAPPATLTSAAKYSDYISRSRSRSNSYRTSTSPRKAYMDLIGKQQSADSAAASGIPRPASPSKPWERPSAAMASPDDVARPRSPFKSAGGGGFFAPSSPTKASGVQIPTTATSSRLGASIDSSYTSPRKDAATSPLKPEEVPFAKTVTASSALGSNSSSSINRGAPAPSWRSSTLSTAKVDVPHPASPQPQEGQRSATFPSAPTSPTAGDRNPTASLTRLSAKKMVGQRIREAQQRDVQAHKESESTTVAPGVGAGLSKYGGSAYGAGGVRDRWPAGAPMGGSTASTPTQEENKKIGGWSPSKFGNALPGLAGRSPPKSSSAAGAGGFGTSPSKRYADDDAAELRAAPVRLPGMGGEASPFKRFSAAPSSPTKEEQIERAGAGDVLQPLTKGRVRGPARRPAAAAAAAAVSTTALLSSAHRPSLQVATSPTPAGASTSAASSSPKKVISGFGAPGSPSKTQVLASKFGGDGGGSTAAAATPSSPTKGSFTAAASGPRSPVKATFGSTTTTAAATTGNTMPSTAPASTKPRRSTRGKRVHVLISGSGSNLQSLIDATLLDPPRGIPVIPNAQISFVLSNRKAAYGLKRASESNPPIPTKVLALKMWQNANPGGTREEYDRVLARAVLDGDAEGKATPPDLVVLAGFMHIVSEGFLHALGHKTSLPSSTPTIGTRPSKAVPIINLHPALPGAFDGVNAIPRAFEAVQQGLTDRTGCMVHEVVADVDRGRPLIVREIVVRPGWDLAKLEEEIHKIEHVIIVEGARQVLEGRLEELDREQEAKEKEQAEREARQTRQAPQQPRPLPSRSLSETVHIQSAEDAASVAFKAEQALKTSSFEPDAILSYGAPSASPPAGKLKTVSVDVIGIRADGTPKAIDGDADAGAGTASGYGISDVPALYDDETLAVVHRFKAASGLMENQVWIRLGMRSPLHPMQQGHSASSLSESSDEVWRRAEELAKRYGTEPTFVPAGFENVDLIDALDSRWTVTRQGSRARFDAMGTGLYRVRRAIGAAVDAGRTTITQVDLTTSNLCSGDSFVASVLGSALVWHGRGSDAASRDAARQFARALQLEASSGASGDRISENEEGREDGFFWDLFDRDEAYASAWYHGLAHGAAATSSAVQLFDLGLERGTLTLHPAIEAGCFGQMDLCSAQRQDEISLLNLSNRELYVVVGERARNDRVKILAGCLLAERLAAHLESSGGPEREAGRPATHVLVLPSRIPREVRAAARYWDDALYDNLGGGSAKMNVKTTREAAKEVTTHQWPRETLLDPSWLPVGVAEEDVGVEI